MHLIIHENLAKMYVEDERFRAYYDAVGHGAAEFLRDAVAAYAAGLEELRI